MTPEEQKQLNALRQQEEKIVIRIKAILDSSMPNQKELVRLQQQKNDLASKQNSILNVTEKNLKKVAETAEELVESSADSQKLFKGLIDQSKKFGKNNQVAAQTTKTLQGFLAGSLMNTEQAVSAAERVERIKKLETVHGGLASQQAKAYADSLATQVDIATQLGGVYSDLADESQIIAQNEVARGRDLLQTLNTAAAQERLSEAEVFYQQNKANLRGKELKQVKQSIREAQKAVVLLEQQADLIDYQISASEAAANAIVGPFENAKSAIESIPGIGTGLSKALGLDVMSGQLNEIVTKSVQVGLRDGAAAGVANFKQLVGQTKIFGVSLKSALLPLIAVTALVGAVALFASMSKETEELAANTGQSAAQSEKMLQSARQLQASSANTLSSSQEIVAAMTALKEEFGSTANFSGETALNISNMSAAFGIAVGDAAAVQRQFEAMGQTSEEAFNTQALTANLAEAAGVAPGKVMADIAKSSKAAAKFLGGNSKALAKAAVEAAKLGMELNDMVSIADGLLDIESSIEAEFEASVMLGKQINMDLARQLALQGDIEGATKAVLDQVGSIHDFNNMDVLQRKKIAQAAGMEVGQLQNALQKQEQLNNLTAEQRKRYDEASKALEGSTLSGEDLVRQQEQALAAKEMSASFDKIKNTLMKAVYPVIKTITDIFTNVLSPVIDVVSGAFKGIMFVLSPILLALKGIAKVIEFLSPALKVVAGIFGAIYATKLLINNADKIALGREKISQGFAKAKQLFTDRHYAKQLMIRASEKIGLINAKQKKLALGANTMLENKGADAVAKSNLYKNQGLMTQIKSNAQKVISLAKEKAKLVYDKAQIGFQKLKNIMFGTQLGTETAINTQKKTGLLHSAKELAINAAMIIKKGALFLWETLTNKEKLKGLGTMILQTGQYVIQQGILLAQQAINLAINAILAIRSALQAGGIAGLIAQAGAGIAAAVGPIFATFAAIPFGLGIPLAIAAIAGMVALFASMGSKKADDLVSGPSGGGGYGSRVLLAPEGTFSFNNKDTIIAGTKLNDAVIGGAAGSIGDGPVESEVTDLGKDAARKLMKIHMTAAMVASSPFGMLMGGLGAIGGGLSGLFGGDDEESEEGQAVHDATNATKMDEMLAKLDQLISAISSAGGGSAQQGPVQIVIGNKVIEEISGMMNVNKSYNILAGGTGEE